MLSVLSKDILEGGLVKWKVDGRMEMRGRVSSFTGKTRMPYVMGHLTSRATFYPTK